MTINRIRPSRIAAIAALTVAALTVAALTVAGFIGGIAPAVAGPFGTGSAQAQPGNLGPFE
ncbi:hypothetical protein ACQPXH_05845 [Nocardia sp. CA-135953]|uniref:hypothetical protein n=1 Tax=Nocardia sp. CA-135953 TaxID=3239978 RepID=UPI003D98121C